VLKWELLKCLIESQDSVQKSSAKLQQ